LHPLVCFLNRSENLGFHYKKCNFLFFFSILDKRINRLHAVATRHSECFEASLNQSI
jgi:hypothetical protein